MALSRVTPTGWLEETGTISRVTPTGWVQETQATGGGATASSADPGSLVLTGSASTGLRARLSSTVPGGITLTGTTSTGLRARLSSTVPGALTLTGSAATSTYTPVGSTASSAQPGQIALAGSASTGLRALRSITDPGQIVLTGSAAASGKSILSAPAPGQIVLSGSALAEATATGELAGGAATQLVHGWIGDARKRRYITPQPPTPEQVESERIRLGIIEPARQEVARIAKKRAETPKASPQHDELALLEAMLRNDLARMQADYETRRAIALAQREEIAYQVAAQAQEEADMAFVIAMLAEM